LDATSYDVYFSTNQTLVNSSSASVLVANVTGLSYSPGVLSTSTTYYWKIVPKNAIGVATGCATYSFTTNSTAGLPNDFCSTASNLPCGTYNLSGTTVGAIAETPPSGCSSYISSYGVWYTFTGNGQATTINLQGLGGFDTGMGIYSGSCGSLTNIACRDATFASDPENYTFSTVNGVNYYIYVSYFDNGLNTTGTFTISRTCEPSCANNQPAGNTCQDAEPICDFNGYCGNTSNLYTADTWSELSNAFSGASIENNSFISFIAASSTVTLEIFVSNCFWGDGIQMMIFSAATCGSGPVTALALWNPGIETNATITASGLTPGNKYYLMIDGYAGDDCDYVIGASSSSGVTVPVVASNDISICAGASTVLSATGGNGSYTWNPSMGLSSNLGASVTATPSQTTTYTVTSSTGNPQCPVTTENQVTVTVNPYPTANITATTLCAGAGNTATLTATGGGTYLWSPGGQTTAAISVSSAGSYSVQVTSNGCTSSASTTISVSNPPSIISISPP